MTSDRGRARVVVVDDTRFDRELAKSAMEDLADVECCAGVDEAMQALERQPADLVISDLHMPRLSGLDLLEHIHRRHPGTDFVLLTAHASVDSAIEALRMGASDYLRKPIRPEELSVVVERTLARRRLLHENVRLRDSLATLEACRALTPCLEAAEVYPAALDLILHSLERERGIALFRRLPWDQADAVAFRGLSEADGTRLRAILLESKSIDLDAMRGVEILSRSPVHEALRRAEIPVGRLLAVPILGAEREGGALWIAEDDCPFTEAEVERASLVAGHAQLAVRNAERYTRAKERAFVDDVTELYNARYLLEAANREVQRSERYGSDLCVLFLDLDRFKLVNDRYGHLVGSQTLRRLGRILAQSVRQVDTLARYGGDEFTILLVDTDARAGLSIAERIRHAVESAPFETGVGEPIHLTLSIGVATYPRHGRSREELLDAADKAMYRAKSRGRNRVCSAEELEG